MGNFKGEENQTPAVELFKQEVEAWCVAKSNHIPLDKSGSVIGSQNGKYHPSPPPLLLLLSLALALSVSLP